MNEELGFTVWYFQGEIELEAAFSFCFPPSLSLFMDGMMKAQEGFYVEQVSQIGSVN